MTQPPFDSSLPSTGNLLTEPVLLVNQKAKLFELKNEYAVLNEGGQPVGAVVQVGQSAFRLITRMSSGLDAAMPVHLEVRDPAGSVLLHLDRPWFRHRMNVSTGDGRPLGQVRMRIRIGKARLVMDDPAGNALGEVHAENWRAWDFRVADTSGNELGRVTKKWAGLAKEFFTDADNYVVQLSPGLADPLRSLVIASTLTIDTLLKQNKG